MSDGATSDRPLYPVDQSFVLQIRCDGFLAEDLIGRVEHLASGHASQFDSVAELLRFIREAIAAAAVATRAPPSGAPTEQSRAERNLQPRAGARNQGETR